MFDHQAHTCLASLVSPKDGGVSQEERNQSLAHLDKFQSVALLSLTYHVIHGVSYVTSQSSYYVHWLKPTPQVWTRDWFLLSTVTYTGDSHVSTSHTHRPPTA